jgi:hypothetical protein
MMILTCQEFKVDCEEHDGLVPANPDIAGIGVNSILLFLPLLRAALTQLRS